MTVYAYPPLASVHTTADGDNAFDFDSANNDTLLVGTGAFLITEGQSIAALLGNNGAWTVNVNGTIFAGQSVGIRLETDNPDISSITIGSNGKIGGDYGIQLYSRGSLTNAGVITGDFIAVATGDTGLQATVRTIKNTGLIKVNNPSSGVGAAIWISAVCASIGSQTRERSLVT